MGRLRSPRRRGAGSCPEGSAVSLWRGAVEVGSTGDQEGLLRRTAPPL